MILRPHPLVLICAILAPSLPAQEVFAHEFGTVPVNLNDTRIGQVIRTSTQAVPGEWSYEVGYRELDLSIKSWGPLETIDDAYDFAPKLAEGATGDTTATFVFSVSEGAPVADLISATTTFERYARVRQGGWERIDSTRPYDDPDLVLPHATASSFLTSGWSNWSYFVEDLKVERSGAGMAISFRERLVYGDVSDGSFDDSVLVGYQPDGGDWEWQRLSDLPNGATPRHVKRTPDGSWATTDVHSEAAKGSSLHFYEWDGSGWDATLVAAMEPDQSARGTLIFLPDGQPGIAAQSWSLESDAGGLRWHRRGTDGTWSDELIVDELGRLTVTRHYDLGMDPKPVVSADGSVHVLFTDRVLPDISGAWRYEHRIASKTADGTWSIRSPFPYLGNEDYRIEYPALVDGIGGGSPVLIYARTGYRHSVHSFLRTETAWASRCIGDHAPSGWCYLAGPYLYDSTLARWYYLSQAEGQTSWHLDRSSVTADWQPLDSISGWVYFADGHFHSQQTASWHYFAKRNRQWFVDLETNVWSLLKP